MKIRDYVSNVASLLSLWDSTKIDIYDVNNNDSITVNRINKLAGIVNGIIREIATFYVPLILSRHIKTSNGVVSFSNLWTNVVSVEKVVSDQGKEIGFETYHNKIVMSEKSATVYFRIIPNGYNYGNEIDYREIDLPKKVIEYGTAAEFCLTEGLFDEAVVWHEKYREQLKLITKPKNYNTAKRAWA